MRIKLKSEVFGAWRGKPGDEVDRPDKEAQQLIAGGFAEPVKAVEPIETTELPEKLETTST